MEAPTPKVDILTFLPTPPAMARRDGLDSNVYSHTARTSTQPPPCGRWSQRSPEVALPPAVGANIQRPGTDIEHHSWGPRPSNLEPWGKEGCLVIQGAFQSKYPHRGGGASGSWCLPAFSWKMAVFRHFLAGLVDPVPEQLHNNESRSTVNLRFWTKPRAQAIAAEPGARARGYSGSVQSGEPCWQPGPAATAQAGTKRGGERVARRALAAGGRGGRNLDRKKRHAKK